MTDPFLLAHIVKPRIFEIGGLISPVSIRDQMIRGRLIVDRAIEVGLIRGQQHPLIIVGAGAAGVTAAMRAASLGVRTFLVEKEATPFSRQLNCQSRWIDPAQYDWPIHHWDQGIFPPWTPPSMPLPWKGGTSEHVATSWFLLFNQFRRNLPSGLLDVYYSTHASPPTVSGGRVSVPIQMPGGSSSTLSGSVVVSCIGFGTENCDVGSFSGYRFWDTDPFEKYNFGLAAHQQAEVLISGGGDGSLQDFLRIVTGRSAKAVYKGLKNNLSISSTMNMMENVILAAEDHAQRAFLWGRNHEHDHDVHNKLHQVHAEVINTVRTNDPAIWKLISDEIRKMLRPDLPSVELAYRCEHFSQCYSLNRFLVLLIAAYMQDQSGRTPLRSCVRVEDVGGVGTHSCSSNPKSCYGQDHTVFFRESTCTALGTSSSISKYNVLIIRHGPKQLQYISRGKPHPSNRQLLPYHVSS